MFLTNPTIDELKLLDLSVLMKMLTQQTEDYKQFLNEEGFITRTMSVRVFLHKIQEAIEAGKQINIEIPKIIPSESTLIVVQKLG